MTRVFTTGQVARIFSVNINTVIKWFDTGRLEGFRLPRSNERRIYRESVAEFMDAHGISPALLDRFDEAEGIARAARMSTRGSVEDAAGSLSADAPGIELRNFERKPVDLPGNVEDLGVRVPVVVRNLSLGGLYLTGFRGTDGRIPEQLVVQVRGGEGVATLEGVCQLVHLRRTRDDGFGLGCRFTQVDPSALLTYLQRL